MRKAYGGAYIAMNSKNMGADMVFSWPIAQIAVMGAEGAVGVIYRKEIEEATDSASQKETLIKQYEDAFMNPYVAAARGYIGKIIRPQETRKNLAIALSMLKNKNRDSEQIVKRHGNIPL